MKTLTALLLASGLAILNALSVSAQEQTQQQGFPMPTMATCDSVENMTNVIMIKYNEQALVSGNGSVFAQNGQMLVGNMTVWANAETRSFSVTLDNGTIMCLLSSGTEFGAPKVTGDHL